MARGKNNKPGVQKNVKKAAVETEVKPLNVLADAPQKKEAPAVAAPAEKAEEKVEKTAAPVEKKEEAPVQEKRKPGRPAGSTNKKPKAGTRKNAKKEVTDAKAEVYVQFQGMEYSEKSIMDKVVAAWEAEGKKASALKRVKLYVKPEERKAYYVANEKLKNASTGAVDL
jgi:hypothetical protein